MRGKRGREEGTRRQKEGMESHEERAKKPCGKERKEGGAKKRIFIK